MVEMEEEVEEEEEEDRHGKCHERAERCLCKILGLG